MSKYDLLLSPFKLGNLTLKNRMVSAPTSLAEMGPGGVFSPENIAYYELRAKGGAAIVNVGEAVAHGATGPDHPSMVTLDNPSAVPSMYDLVSTIHKYGAYASIEFGHGGKRCNPLFLPGHVLPIGPCDIFDDQGNQTVRGMDRKLMDDVIGGYRRSAANCAAAGFDILTIHCGHGWLLGQFLSELSNHRTDEYGGSRENRCRFVIEVLKAVRQGAPKCLVEIRISGSELTKNGYDVNEGVEICKLLEPYVDLFNVSAGVMEDLYTWILMHPSMFVPDGVNVYLAEAVKKAVSKPVSCVGAIGDPDQMESILENGQADLIAMGRALVADPDLPNKVRDGRTDEIRRCLRCFTCQGQMMKTRNIICAVNPVIGQEYDTKYRLPAAHKHKVAVVGGGPGGMQAAITCAERGHEVTLYEATDSLGGALKFAEHEDFKNLLDKFAKWQAHQLELKHVPVKLNTTITKEFLDDLDVDTVICAVGSNPITPDMFGIPGDNYVLGTALFDEGVTVGKKVVIMGGGLVGCETALHLAETGHEVTIIEMAPEIAAETTAAHRRALKVRMGLYPQEAGQQYVHADVIPPVLATSTKCKEITPEGVIAVTPDGTEQLFEADTVICALGLRSKTALVDELRGTKHNFIPIGDCVRTQQVTQAVRAGYDAAVSLD
ncbi:MAG: FAD-dependent oxidoreductase [Oscillospiraceae bacterium]|nr:FAD-dependent oxidoreductase [Oscillospiraceae bacterium]